MLRGGGRRVHEEPSREELADAGARFPLPKRSRADLRTTMNATTALRHHLSGEQEHQQRYHSHYNNSTRDDNRWSRVTSVFDGEDEYGDHARGSRTGTHTTRVQAEEKAEECGDDDPATRSLLHSLSSSESPVSYFTWRLPANQGLDASEQYLNEQLVHVAGSVALELDARTRSTGLDAAQQGEGEAMCRLSLHRHVWSFIRSQTAFTAASKEKLQKDKDEAEKSIRDTMDVISLLLYLRQQELARQSEMNERLQLLEKELQRKENAIHAVSTELDVSKQNMAQQENHFRAKELAFVNERKTWQTEKKSLDVMVARLQGVETSYKAQLRRKDAEYERLRKTLQDSVARTSKEQRGITVGKPLNGVAERKRTAQQSQSHESQLTKQIMENFERKKAELLFENEALVNSYDGLQRQLELLTSQYRKAAHLFLAKKGPDGQSEELLELASVPIDDFIPTAFNMPSKQHLPRYISKSMDVLHDKIGQFEVAMRADLEQDALDDRDEAIEILRKKLAEAQEIITEQDHLLQASLVNQPVGLVASGHERWDSNNASLQRRFSLDSFGDIGEENKTTGDHATRPRSTGRYPVRSSTRMASYQALDISMLEEFAEDLEHQKRELEQKRNHVDQERQLLDEQAMKLDQDRLAFEMAKQEHMFRPSRVWEPGAAVGSTEDFAMAEVASRSMGTPTEKKRTTHAAGLDDVDMDSPFRVPVPATPGTAALLEKIGVIARGAQPASASTTGSGISSQLCWRIRRTAPSDPSSVRGRQHGVAKEQVNSPGDDDDDAGVWRVRMMLAQLAMLRCARDRSEQKLFASLAASRTPHCVHRVPRASRFRLSVSPMLDDVLSVRYGQKIRLAAVSAYLPPSENDNSDNASDLLGIGYYEKNGRHGILSCVPPLGEKLDHLFNEDEYLVLDPSEQHDIGEAVEYGHTVVLVNQHGMVWNNKTGGITGYVGPRPRNIPGEMFVAFQKLSPGSGASSAGSGKDKTASAPAILTSQASSASTSSATSASSSNVSSIPSSAASSSLVQAGSQGPLRYGDRNIAIKVVESNRHSVMFNKRLSNFKKPTSRIAGGYICCDGKGSDLKFTVCPAQPRVEQISMMNKLITSYNYGQKIALPLALLESIADKAKGKNGGIQQAEIRFQLSNQATAVLPGKVLHEKLLAHAVADYDEESKHEKESIFVLPLHSGPGELVLKLIGCAPKQAIGKISGDATKAETTGAISGTTMLQQFSLFYKLVDVMRMVPVPVFALLYAILTHFLWSSLTTMEDGLKRELVVLVLVAFPAFYVAVKVDHPFSSLFQPPPVGQVQEAESPTNANLKLIVTEYRFPLSATGGSPIAPAATETGSVVVAVSTAASADSSSSTTLVTTVPKRFVLAEKGDEVKALARYQDTLAWRREENLSEILCQPSPNFKTIKENYPHYYHKRGKRDEPVYYEKPGKINLKALKGAGLNLDDLMRNYMMVTEFLWQVIESDDNKKCISVIDVEGIGISDFRGEAVEYVKKAAAVSGKHYPERCAYIFVINIPSWFNVIWNVVKGMIDEVTREKVVMVRGKKNILEALLERIPLENIPEEYGGTSEGSSPEETMLHGLMAYLNKDADAPATNPVEHILKTSNKTGIQH